MDECGDGRGKTRRGHRIAVFPKDRLNAFATGVSEIVITLHRGDAGSVINLIPEDQITAAKVLDLMCDGVSPPVEDAIRVRMRKAHGFLVFCNPEKLSHDNSR